MEDKKDYELEHHLYFFSFKMPEDLKGEKVEFDVTFPKEYFVDEGVF